MAPEHSPLRLRMTAATRFPATMEAGMTEQALFEGIPARPALTEAETAREPLVAEISIDGMRGVY